MVRFRNRPGREHHFAGGRNIRHGRCFPSFAVDRHEYAGFGSVRSHAGKEHLTCGAGVRKRPDHAARSPGTARLPEITQDRSENSADPL